MLINLIVHDLYDKKNKKKNLATTLGRSTIYVHPQYEISVITFNLEA